MSPAPYVCTCIGILDVSYLPLMAARVIRAEDKRARNKIRTGSLALCYLLRPGRGKGNVRSPLVSKLYRFPESGLPLVQVALEADLVTLWETRESSGNSSKRKFMEHDPFSFPTSEYTRSSSSVDEIHESSNSIAFHISTNLARFYPSTFTD